VKLITKEIERKLRKNWDANHRADGVSHEKTKDHVPVVKFFNPCGAATWLFTELDPDGDTLFGLCDLGFGTPELGSASLQELASMRLRFGLKIERDLHFKAVYPLSVYTRASRDAGRIVEEGEKLRIADARNSLDHDWETGAALYG
jgi:hypothetical protein